MSACQTWPRTNPETKVLTKLLKRKIRSSSDISTKDGPTDKNNVNFLIKIDLNNLSINKHVNSHNF